MPTALATIKALVHSTLDSLEAKGNCLAYVSIKDAALKGTNNQSSVMVLRDAASNDNLEKLIRYNQQFAPEREKQFEKQLD